MVILSLAANAAAMLLAQFMFLYLLYAQPERLHDTLHVGRTSAYY
jgi:hypothetical protein